MKSLVSISVLWRSQGDNPGRSPVNPALIAIESTVNKPMNTSAGAINKLEPTYMYPLIIKKNRHY
jgi:hypothetical protein